MMEIRSNKKTIVVIAATEMEIAECRNALSSCKFVVSGIGATNTAIATMRAIEQYRPDLIIQIGIAGAKDSLLKIGDVVFVTEDYQADLGAWREEEGRFVAFETPRIRVDNSTNFPGVKARSVNTSCAKWLNDDDYQVESMEGAAFFQAAKYFDGLIFAQIRSISNYVDSPRAEWNIPKALSVLPGTLGKILAVYLQHVDNDKT